MNKKVLFVAMAGALCCGMGISKADDTSPPYHAPSQSKAADGTPPYHAPVQSEAADAKTVPYSYQIDFPRFGNLKLGMTKSQVINSFPLKFTSKHHSYEVDEMIFLYKTPSQPKAILDVLLQKDRVIQIATTDHRYKLADGANLFNNMGNTRLHDLKLGRINAIDLFSNMGNIQTAASQVNLVLKKIPYYFQMNKGVKRIDFYDFYSQGASTGVSLIVIPTRADESKSHMPLSILGFDLPPYTPMPNYVLIHASGRPVIGILNSIRGSVTPPKGYKLPKPKQTPLNKTQRYNAHKALNALRHLEAAASVGTYSDFSSDFVDTKIAVDDSLRSIPNGNLKNEINAAMSAYVGAQTFWRQSITNDSDAAGLLAANASKTASRHIANIEKLLR